MIFTVRHPMAYLLKTSIVLSILAVAPVVLAAEFELHPSLAVNEEFTDNVFETPTNRTSDYITRLLPGVAAHYLSPALKGDLNYLFDYRYYAKKNRDDEITHALSAKANLNAVENFMYLDVADEYQRVSLDTTRDVTRESLFLDQSDRNVFSVSPYITLRPNERSKLKAGYRFIDTRYFKSSAINKKDHIAYTEMVYEISKRFSLTANYTFTKEFSDVDNFFQHRALGGFRYEYTDSSFLFVQGGNVWTRYDKSRRLSSIVWDAGFTHVFDTVTATVATDVRYNEDPLSDIIKESYVSGSIEKRLSKGSVSFSPMYSEYDPTKKDALRTKKIGATARGQYGLTSDLNATLNVTAEKYEQPNIRRFLVDSGFSYLLARQLTVSLLYTFVDYYSSNNMTENRHINRGIIEIKKIF